MKSIFSPRLVLWSAILQIGLWWSQPLALSGQDAGPAPVVLDMTNLVHSIELPHLEPDLAVAPGRNEFMAVCVGCHSPRYVLMQPPFAQPQWEATVDKMVKNYGAQMDKEQRTAIVGYLLATHGPNAVMQLPSTDEDSPPVQLPPPSESAPLLRPPTDSSQRAEEFKRGENLFAQNCAGCHGRNGRGDGFVAPVLLRKPKNLATTRFSLELLSQVLWNGKPGTAMPSWRGLPESDRAALANYVQSLHHVAKPGLAFAKATEQGSSLFLQNCAPCHGEAGDGKGATAANLLPRPANFKLKQPDSDYLLEVLRDGIPGTAMPSWRDQISAIDRAALAGFVRSLFETTDSGRP